MRAMSNKILDKPGPVHQTRPTNEYTDCSVNDLKVVVGLMRYCGGFISRGSFSDFTLMARYETLELGTSVQEGLIMLQRRPSKAIC